MLGTAPGRGALAWSKDLACLSNLDVELRKPEVVALRTASCSHLLHQVLLFPGYRHLAPPRRQQASPCGVRGEIM